MSEKEENSVVPTCASLVASNSVNTIIPAICNCQEVFCTCNSASSAVLPPKRPNSGDLSDSCEASENKPFAFYCKRQRTKSENEDMESLLKNCPENEHSNNKKSDLDLNGQPNAPHYPLSERNIRVESDHNRSSNNNGCYSVSDRLTSVCESNSDSEKSSINVKSKSTCGRNENGLGDTSDKSLSNNISNSSSKSPDEFAPLPTSSVSSDIHCSISTSTSSDLLRSSALQQLTTPLDANLSCNAASSTLAYVAKLITQSPILDVFEDSAGCTPPYAAAHHTPMHTPQHQCSGDEDDDNYLDDSSDDGDEDGGDNSNNNDEEESCGEDDGSVVSTVGSTCSLRSVASEALAAICRNDKGQTTNKDGTLLYNFTPSTQPLPPLSPSLFSHVPPALRFCQHNEVCRPLPECVAKLLKWRHTSITPLIIRKTVLNSGYKMTKRTTLWSGTWGKHMKSVCYKTVRTFQKVNHFPGTFQIGRKDKLWHNFLRLQEKFGKEEFGFIPKTFILPADLKALKTAFEKEGVKKKWIVKPPASARGTGIEVVDKWSQLDLSIPLVVQRYVSRPYLINNTKFDLRIYVAVTSFHPLRIYLYQDGLVRFASVEYRNESQTLSDRFMHLTNYSVNKSNSSYTHNTDAGECQGHRWTLCTLWGYLKAQGVDTGALWSRVADMVIKTMLSGEHDIVIRARKNLRSKYCSFELFGFDVLLDEKLRPWLLEVNISPSLHSASSLDYMVKGPLMSHLLTMACYHVPDHRSLTAQMQCEVLSELGLQSRVSRLTLDHRLFTRLLTENEQLKHAHINSLPRSQYLTAVLESLTPDDVRHLLLGEDELQRTGKFTCIFPTAETHQYFGFMEKPRYYNRLWDAWENTYGHCRETGIERLEKLCAEKLHLQVPPKFKMPKVMGAPPPKLQSKEDSTSPTKSCSSSMATGSSASTPDTEGTPSIISSSSTCSSSLADVSESSVDADHTTITVSAEELTAGNKRAKHGCLRHHKRRRVAKVNVRVGQPSQPSALLMAGLVTAARSEENERLIEEDDFSGSESQDEAVALSPAAGADSVPADTTCDECVNELSTAVSAVTDICHTSAESEGVAVESNVVSQQEGAERTLVSQCVCGNCKGCK